MGDLSWHSHMSACTRSILTHVPFPSRIFKQVILISDWTVTYVIEHICSYTWSFWELSHIDMMFLSAIPFWHEHVCLYNECFQLSTHFTMGICIHTCDVDECNYLYVWSHLFTHMMFPTIVTYQHVISEHCHKFTYIHTCDISFLTYTWHFKHYHMSS